MNEFNSPALVQPAIINRLLMKLDSRYFAKNNADKARFRVLAHETFEDTINKYLMNSLFNKSSSNESWDQLSEQQKAEYNAHTTMLSGIGESYLAFNEYLPEGKTLLDYATLYDYDLEDYLFQMEGLHGGGIPPYNLHLSSIWARFLDSKCRFYYSTVTSIASYLISKIEDTWINAVYEVIPNKLVPGSNHGKKKSGGYQWDMKIDANGKEPVYNELQQRCFQYEESRYNELKSEFHNIEDDEPSVFFVRPEDTLHAQFHLDIVVKNVEAAKKIHFNNFFDSCNALRKDEMILNDLVAREVLRVQTFVQKQFEDISNNAQPNIVTLNKNSSVIVAEGISDHFL